jgi:hypothetical protein
MPSDAESGNRLVLTNEGERMRLPLFSRIVFFSLVVLLGGSAALRADWITGTLEGGPITGQGGILNPGADVKINLGDGSKPSIDYYPGVVNWTVGTAPGSTPNASWVGAVGSAFQTFCIELTQDIYSGGTYTFKLVNLANAPKPGSGTTGNGNGMGSTKATAIEDLWTLDYKAKWVTDSTKTTTDNIEAAAFQLAIWKIENDWGDAKTFDNFSAGNFQASAATGTDGAKAIAQATTWLTTLSNTNPNSVNPADLIALSSPGLQDQVMAVPSSPSFVPTPAPSTLYLAVIGAAALVLYGYRRGSRLAAAARAC